jgi:hypothetical protein
VREGAHGKRPAETPTPRPWAYLTPGDAGGREAALTKPGRIGTARWCGSGKRDEKVHARNQC